MTFTSSPHPLARSPRLMALLLALVVIIAACSGDGATGPTTPVGNYQLATVNGKPLPYRLFADTGFTVDIAFSSLAVKVDGSFLAAFRSEERVENNLSVYVDSAAGRWTQVGSAITFTSSDSVKQTATWTRNSITLSDSSTVVPLLYVYSRR